MATTKNIQSIERAFAVLESLRDAQDGEYSVKELSDLLSLNKSTAFGIINTINELGYLSQNPDNQKYALSPRFLSLAAAVKEQTVYTKAMRPFLNEITAKFRVTTHCAIRDGRNVVYIDKVESAGSIYISSNIGMRNEMYCTGVGKCILAYMPVQEVDIIFSGSHPAFTAHTIVNADTMRAELINIRKNGYAMDREESSLGLSCVAVPVFSAKDKVAFAISASGATIGIQEACQNGLIESLNTASSAVSKSLFCYYHE